MFRCAARAITPKQIVEVIGAAMAALAILLASPASAQSHRNFPAHALRGELLINEPPEGLLNGRPARLAPGARIRGDDNMLRMSGALAGQKVIVHYTRENGTGLLQDIWVLNATERANRMWPTSEADARAWVFDPVGQTWSGP